MSGWPDPFPGKYLSNVSALARGVPENFLLPRSATSASNKIQRYAPEAFDIVAHHAVFSPPMMRRLVPGARFVTIVRDPGLFVSSLPTHAY